MSRRTIALVGIAVIAAFILIQAVFFKPTKREHAGPVAGSKQTTEPPEHAIVPQCTGGGKRIGPGTFRAACEDLVRKQLLSPRSAKFPGITDGLDVQQFDDCSARLSTWVDAKNAFGAELRHPFLCSYDPKTEAVSVTLD